MPIELAAFKAPPLNELSIGLQFEKLKELPLPEYAKIWDALGGPEEYPVVENQARLFPIPEPGADRTRINLHEALPRVWFLKKDKCHLFQYQSDRMNYNWRAIEATDCYPRYEPLVESFLKHYCDLSELMEKGYGTPIKPNTLEMSYINLIPKADIGSFDQIEKLLNIPFWKPKALKFADEMQSFQSAVQVSMDEFYAVLTINTTSAMHAETGEEFVRIDLSAHGKCVEQYSKGVDGLKLWYDGIRIAIVDSFDKITTSGMHEKWGRHVRTI